MLSPTHIATRSGGRPSVPAWTAAKRGFLSLGPVWHKTAEATMPAEARFARVAGHPASERLVTITTRPPSSRTSVVNARAPGRAVAARRSTHAAHVSDENPCPTAARSRW